MFISICLIMLTGSILFATTTHQLGLFLSKLCHTAPAIVSTLLTLSAIIVVGSGLMALIQKTPLLQRLAQLLSNPVTWLFQGIDRNHRAVLPIALNLSANMLGCGNAATPAGIAAMHALQSDNDTPNRATHHMCLFLAVNTASIQLIPTSVLLVLSASGNPTPWTVWPAILFTSIVTTGFAMITARLTARWSRAS